MKIQLILAVFFAVVILPGCKEDNPVVPPVKPPIEERAQALYNGGNEVITSANTLKSEYTVGAEEILSALYKAGYVPQNITSAVRVVFQKDPVYAEPILTAVLKGYDAAKIAELILYEYVGYLKQHKDELLYYAGKLTDTGQIIWILKSPYSLSASEIYILLYGMGRTPLEILSPLKNSFGLTNEECITLMTSNNAEINEITEVLRDLLYYSDEDAAQFLLSRNYSLSKVIGAVKAGYHTLSVRMAHILSAYTNPMKEFLTIMLESYTLDETAYVIKNYYLLDANAAAVLLKEMNFDAKAIALVLKDVYNLNYTDILTILKNLGFELYDLAIVLLDIFKLPFNEMVDILVELGYDYCTILHIFNFPC